MRDFDELTTWKKEQVFLSALQLGLQEMLTPALLSGIRVNASIDDVTGYITYQLRALLWGEKVKWNEVRRQVHCPENWWQHFKLECLPEWFKRKWPVRYAVAELVVERDAWKLYPDLNVPFNLPNAQFTRYVEQRHGMTYRVTTDTPETEVTR